jgi:hypothetical protein
MTAAAGASHHAVHIGTLLGPALLIAFWATWSELRTWLRRSDVPELATAALVAAALSVGAAAVHVIVIPPHVAESLVYGVFFAGLAAAQLGWALLVLVRPGARVLVVGALLNAGVLVLWAVTRTAGVPWGVAVGRREPIGALDTTCSLLELGVVDLAAGLDLETVAEGVEDQATLDLLREMGADFVQGFHVGRPAPVP